MKSENSNTGDFVFLIVSIIFIGIIAVKSTLSLFDTIDWMRESHATLKNIDDIYLSLKDAETNAKAYILIGEPSFLESYRNSSTKVISGLKELKKETRDDENYEDELPVLEDLINENTAYWKDNIDLKINNELSKDSLKQITSASSTSDTLRTIMDKMRLTESNTLERVRKNENFNAMLTIGTVVMDVLLTIIFGFKYVRTMKKSKVMKLAVREAFANSKNAAPNIIPPVIKDHDLN